MVGMRGFFYFIFLFLSFCCKTYLEVYAGACLLLREVLSSILFHS